MYIQIYLYTYVKDGLIEGILLVVVLELVFLQKRPTIEAEERHVNQITGALVSICLV